jgi:cyclic pyranopterin phosphate synthase
MSAQSSTVRAVAVASGRIRMKPATLRMVARGSAKKGDVLGVRADRGHPGCQAHAEPDPACAPRSKSPA